MNLFGIGGTFILQWAIGLMIGLFPADTAGHYPPVALHHRALVDGDGRTAQPALVRAAGARSSSLRRD